MSAKTDTPRDTPALTDALRMVLLPLARMALARGLLARDVEEMMRVAFIAAAAETQPAPAPTRQISRLATATGLTRREVTRLLQVQRAAPLARRSPATEIFARWLSDPALRSKAGRARSLARQGPAPSFEALAQAVTRDVHPRSLLDELCRLKLARVEADGNTVTLLAESFVPRDDEVRLLGFLGRNVGDHLQAAVSNVIGSAPRRHLEQAVFADDLSEQSLEKIAELAHKQWTSLASALVPAVQRLIDDDRAAGRPQTQRVRIGLYSFSAAAEAPAAPAPRRRANDKADNKAASKTTVRRASSKGSKR